MVSNYEKVLRHFQERLLSIDLQKTAEKLKLEYDGVQICVPFFGRRISIDRKSAEFCDGMDLPLTHKLLVLHHLYYYKPEAINSGVMLPFREIRECAAFEAAYRRSTILPLAEYFSGKPDLLRERAEKLDVEFHAIGDVNFTIKAFPLIPLQFIFWDGDEEFPASVNILFDKNITQFIHPESVPALAGTAATLLSNEHPHY